MTETEWQWRCQGGLAFFGQITASVTHEIKNHLATIKEQSGLMADLLELSARGRPLDLERFHRLVTGIINRIPAADAIVRHLNQLAHSVDDSTQEMDLNEVVGNVVSLGRRLALMNKVTLTMDLAPEKAVMTSSPFFVRELLFRCQQLAIVAAGLGGQVNITVRNVPAGVECSWGGQLDGPVKLEGLPTEVRTSLLDFLGVITSEGAAGELIITFPVKTTGQVC